MIQRPVAALLLATVLALPSLAARAQIGSPPATASSIGLGPASTPVFNALTLGAAPAGVGAQNLRLGGALNYATLNGSAGTLTWSSPNTSSVVKDGVIINCGLATNVAGAENGDCDFNVLLNGASSIVALNAAATSGPAWTPALGDVWNLGGAGQGWKSLYVGTVYTENSEIMARLVNNDFQLMNGRITGSSTNGVALFDSAAKQIANFQSIGTAVNYVQFLARASGSFPSVQSICGDTDCTLDLLGQGALGVRIPSGAGLQIGIPTGGDKGVGTLNPAGAVYDNGTAPTGTAGSGYVRAASPALTTPAIAGGTHTGLTGLAIRDTSAAFDVTLAGTSSTALTAGRTLTLDMKNVAHTLALGATANTITFPNTASYTVIGSGDTGTVTNTMLAGSIATSKLTALSHTQSSVVAPTGTTNTTGDGVMMGLAGTITPTNSGTVHFQVCGDITNSTAGDGANVHLRTGTGSAPANAGALAGTTRGSLIKFVASPATASKSPFCVHSTVTGLALSTAVWIDVSLAAVTGGTASIADVDIVADEIP